MELCLACGLCCDGTIFGEIVLTEEERRRLPLLSPPSQPCPALEADKRCRVYLDRPGACARYECSLLGQHRAGEVSDEQALERIAGVRELVTELRELVGDAASIWRACELHLESDEPRAMRLRGSVLLGMVSLALRIIEGFDPRSAQAIKARLR